MLRIDGLGSRRLGWGLGWEGGARGEAGMMPFFLSPFTFFFSGACSWRWFPPPRL
jgi:hypothetical protein